MGTLVYSSLLGDAGFIIGRSDLHPTLLRPLRSGRFCEAQPHREVERHKAGTRAEQATWEDS